MLRNGKKKVNSKQLSFIDNNKKLHNDIVTAKDFFFFLGKKRQKYY